MQGDFLGENIPRDFLLHGFTNVLFCKLISSKEIIFLFAQISSGENHHLYQYNTSGFGLQCNFSPSIFDFELSEVTCTGSIICCFSVLFVNIWNAPPLPPPRIPPPLLLPPPLGRGGLGLLATSLDNFFMNFSTKNTTLKVDPELGWRHHREISWNFSVEMS